MAVVDGVVLFVVTDYVVEMLYTMAQRVECSIEPGLYTGDPIERDNGIHSAATVTLECITECACAHTVQTKAHE